MKKIKNKKLKLIFVVITLIIAVIAVFNRSTISEYVSGERKIFGAPYSGTCGTSNWTIDNSGVLTIQEGTLPNIDMQNRTEWYQYREYITSVQVSSGVSTSDLCEGLFQDCTNLVSANLTNLNTSNSVHLGHMFDGCTSLTDVTFGANIVTSNTKTINNMFQNCSSMQTIDFSDFSATNIIDMSYFLSGCTSINTITWGSNFNTTNVTNFQGMFLNCENIITLDLSGFNTTNAISGNMKRMLEGMTKCNILILGNDFRFKKTSTTECQVFTTNDMIWKKSGTTTDGNSVLLLENNTNPSGTWLRQYAITYYGNGGTSSNQSQNSNYATYSQTYNIGENAYTRKGYDFVGWTTNSDGSDDGNNWIEENITWNYTVGQKGIKYTSTIELYAMWSPKVYTIKYIGNGGTWNGSTIRTDTVFFGEQYEVPPGNVFYKKGYSFSSWKDGSGNFWGVGISRTWTFDNGEYAITNNTLTLTAQWQPKTFTIIYNGNSGTKNNQTSLSATITYGQTYTIMNNDFYKKGYTHNTWYDTAGGAWPPNSTGTWSYDNGEKGITNNTLMLSAQWSPKVYTVIYHKSRDDNSQNWSENITYGEPYKVWNNWYSWSGHTFIGWMDDNWGWWEEPFHERWYYVGGDYGVNSSGVLNLYGMWRESNTVTVSINHYKMNKATSTGATPSYSKVTFTNNVSGNNDRTSVTKGNGNEVYPMYFRHYIDGFTMESNRGYNTATTLSGNTTFNIYYRPNRLYLKFHLNGGVLSFSHGSAISSSGDYLLYNGSQNFLYGLYNTKIGDVRSNNYYEVADGLSDGFPDINNSSYINLKRVGYTPKAHGEWRAPRPRSLNYIEYDDGGEYDGVRYTAVEVAANSDYALAREDVYADIYANWVPNNYTATLDPNGGTTDTTSKTITYDKSYGTLPVPQKVGNSFKGWSYLPEGYKQLDYIQSTGTQYINTGYRINQKTGIIADYQFTSLERQARVFGVLGVPEDSSSLSYQYYINGSDMMAYAYNNGTGNWIQTPYYANTNRHTLQFNVFGRGFKLDNNAIIDVQGTVTQSPSTRSWLYVFASDGYVNNEPNSFAKLKIYNFAIYEDDVLVHKYIPCVNPNGEVGLYDIVTNTFLSNAGTGSFIAGPEKFVKETDTVKYAASHTLYAKWQANEYKIEYYRGNADIAPNSGENAASTKLGESTIPVKYANNYSLTTYNDLGGTAPEGWRFSGWSEVNEIDNNVVAYQDGASVNSLSLGIQTNSESEILKDGDFVKYVNSNGDEVLCRVLYDNRSEFGRNGVQIVSMSCQKSVELNGTNSSNIDVLNSQEINTLNHNLATGVRSIGSIPNYKDYNDINNSNDNKNYRHDVNKMNTLGLLNINNHYWLASESLSNNIRSVAYINMYGELIKDTVKDSSGNSQTKSHWYRPVYILNNTIFIEEGDGTAEHPYVLAGVSDVTNRSVIKLYAIFERDIKFNSGENGTQYSMATQYFNPVDVSLISEVLAPETSFNGIDNSTWVSNGYRADTQASNYEYGSNTNIQPQFSVVDSTTPSSTTLNLYAIYERYLTMTYDGNGATGGSTTSHVSSVPQYYNSSGTLTSYTFKTKTNGFTKDYYDFYKWAEDSSTGNQIEQETNATAFSPALDSSNTTKTMYALWNAISYTITYNLNDGTISTANPTSYSVETSDFTLSNPTKNGYTFIGWTGTEISEPQKTVTILQGSSGNRSYTANWEPNTVVVTIKRNNQDWSNSGMKVGLYQNGVEKYSTTVSSGNIATFNLVEAGTYDVYSGKNSNNKTTMVDTGKDVEVGE